MSSKHRIKYIFLFLLMMGISLYLFSSTKMVESTPLVKRIQKKFHNENLSLLKEKNSIERHFSLGNIKKNTISENFDNFYLAGTGNFCDASSHYYSPDYDGDNSIEEDGEDYRSFISMDGKYVKFDKDSSVKNFMPNLANLYFENSDGSCSSSVEDSESNMELPLLTELEQTRDEMTAKLNSKDFTSDYDLFKKENISKYIVKNGENLLSISKKLDIPYRTLKKLNKVDSPFVDSGKAISIPKLKKVRKLTTKKLMKMYVKTKKSRGGLMWPVHAKRISSRFGYRIHPITRRRKFHNGVDLAANYGTKIVAAASGVVEFSGWKGYFGKAVIIRHPGGYKTLYGHCSKLFVKKGERVRAGTKIANVGTTGLSTGPHLHFSVIKNGKYLNPLSYLK